MHGGMGLLIDEWGKRILFPRYVGGLRVRVLRSAVSRNARFVEV